MHYSLSEDLIHWDSRKLIRQVGAALDIQVRRQQSDPLPSLLDPDSKSRNFETVGKTPWLYFTRFHYKDCKQTSNRDLVRVPIEFR